MGSIYVCEMYGVYGKLFTEEIIFLYLKVSRRGKLLQDKTSHNTSKSTAAFLEKED